MTTDFMHLIPDMLLSPKCTGSENGSKCRVRCGIPIVLGIIPQVQTVPCRYVPGESDLLLVFLCCSKCLCVL